MANSLLDRYKLLKKDTPTYGDNSLLSIKEGKLVEPSYSSIISPPSDNTVAQLASTNSMTPVEPTPVKYFPDTTRELPINALQNQSITTPTSAPSTPTTAPYTPQTEFEKYWKTPVGTEKYNIPLDQFVRVAGLASKYLDPQNPVANDLIKMGNEAYNARARMEYESPNVLLQRRLHEAQLQKLQEEVPKAWDIFYKEQIKLGRKPEDIVKDWNKITRESQAINYHYAEDEKGNISVYVNGQLVSGSGKGKDISNQVAYHSVDDAGIVHTFDKYGKEIGRTPGGKTKVEPGATARATEDLQKEREARQWTTIGVTTGTDPNAEKQYIQQNKIGEIRYIPAKGNADISRIPSTPESPTQKLIKQKLAPKIMKAKEQATNITNTPTVGAIIKGYRFKGGNPADKNNWEKI